MAHGDARAADSFSAFEVNLAQEMVPGGSLTDRKGGVAHLQTQDRLEGPGLGRRVLAKPCWVGRSSLVVGAEDR
jgi:hypothetical protein